MRRVALLTMVLMLGLAFPARASARGDGVKLLRIRFDPTGADDGSNTSLNNEVVIIANKSPALLDLTGWTLRDRDGHVFRFPSLSLSPEEQVKIHTGSGANNARNLYWGSKNYVWDNDGDRATLRQPGGRIVHGCSYSGSGSQVRCL
jgi:hypothetical protein